MNDKISLLPDIYSDTLDTDISVDVPVRRQALFSTLTLDVPVRPMDAKGLIHVISPQILLAYCLYA